MNEVIEKINKSGWHDWSFKNVHIDYNKVVLSVNYEWLDFVEDHYVPHVHTHVEINCLEYIGISFIGHWDENIIEDIYIEEEGDLINKSLEQVKKHNGDNPPIGGENKQINDKWYQINVKLLDNIVFSVVCKDFNVTTEN